MNIFGYMCCVVHMPVPCQSTLINAALFQHNLNHMNPFRTTLPSQDT
jgi:hypothetical protein